MADNRMKIEVYGFMGKRLYAYIKKQIIYPDGVSVTMRIMILFLTAGSLVILKVVGIK